MRLSAASAANSVAWAIIVGLIGVAFGMVAYLGPFGLFLLGVVILYVCTAMSLRDDAPSWGQDMFRAGMAGPRSPEQRAALAEEKHRAGAPLRFYRWCGVALMLAGAAGFAWQIWN